MNIILYLLQLIQYLYQQNCWLINFICRYIPLKQWSFDDSNSPEYQKLTIDKLPVIKTFIKQNWQFLLEYYQWKYGKPVKPVQRRNGKSIPEDTVYPLCGAPHHYIYDNNGGNGQYQCKVCGQTFTSGEVVTTLFRLTCPHCSHTLSAKKDRKFFRIHKCVNPKCPYYLHRLKQVKQEDLEENYGKNKYKLHYIYREFTVDFFAMDLNSLPKNASSLKFSKHNAHVMSLCLTLHINLGLSLRKTSQALKDLYNINISHQQIANYCKTAAICIKPFVDHYDYKPGKVLTADETYIKVRGIKAFIWFIMDAASRSIIGYQVSDNRSVGPCILTMRMAFRHFKELPENFKFIADGYNAYPLAAMEIARKFKDTFTFNITHVIGLTNDDAVSEKFRPYKQMIERLNRTYKASYRPTNGFSNYDGANYDLALWVSRVKLYFSPTAILPQIKSDISLLISVLVCRFLPHTFFLHSSLTFLTLIYVTKNKRKNSSFHSSFFLFTQYDPYAVPKQDLCPTQYGYPASMVSYTITMIRKKSLFIKLFMIKTSSKSLFEQFMPLVKPELETCPVCGSSGNLHIHCYYKRYLIDFIGRKSVRHDVTVLRCTCDSCGSTHAILPDFIIPYCSYSLFFVLRVLGEYFMHLYTVEKLCERFSITSRQLYKWLVLWKKHKSEWLGFLVSLEVSDKGFLFSLNRMECCSDFTSGFVRTFGFSFLQSHANPKTAVYCQDIFVPDYLFSPTT